MAGAAGGGRARAGSAALDLQGGTLVEPEGAILHCLDHAELVVAVSASAAVSAEGLPVVPPGGAIAWAWCSLEGPHVPLAEAGANHEALVLVLLSAVRLVSVAVALTVAEVVGEQVELGVEDGHVIDGLVKRCASAGDVDALQPVDSHGVENLVDGFSFIKGTLESGLNSILLLLKDINLVIKVPFHSSLIALELCCELCIEISVFWYAHWTVYLRNFSSSNKISKVLPSSKLSVVLSLCHISSLLLEKAELKLERSCNFNEVVVVNLEKAVNSSLEDACDVKFSVIIGSVNFVL